MDTRPRSAWTARAVPSDAAYRTDPAPSPHRVPALTRRTASCARDELGPGQRGDQARWLAGCQSERQSAARMPQSRAHPAGTAPQDTRNAHLGVLRGMRKGEDGPWPRATLSGAGFPDAFPGATRHATVIVSPAHTPDSARLPRSVTALRPLNRPMHRARVRTTSEGSRTTRRSAPHCPQRSGSGSLSQSTSSVVKAAGSSSCGKCPRPSNSRQRYGASTYVPDPAALRVRSTGSSEP